MIKKDPFHLVFWSLSKSQPQKIRCILSFNFHALQSPLHHRCLGPQHLDCLALSTKGRAWVWLVGDIPVFPDHYSHCHQPSKPNVGSLTPSYQERQPALTALPALRPSPTLCQPCSCVHVLRIPPLLSELCRELSSQTTPVSCVLLSILGTSPVIQPPLYGIPFPHQPSTAPDMWSGCRWPEMILP